MLPKFIWASYSKRKITVEIKLVKNHCETNQNCCPISKLQLNNLLESDLKRCWKTRICKNRCRCSRKRTNFAKNEFKILKINGRGRGCVGSGGWAGRLRPRPAAEETRCEGSASTSRDRRAPVEAVSVAQLCGDELKQRNKSTQGSRGHVIGLLAYLPSDTENVMSLFPWTYMNI